MNSWKLISPEIPRRTTCECESVKRPRYSGALEPHSPRAPRRAVPYKSLRMVNGYYIIADVSVESGDVKTVDMNEDVDVIGSRDVSGRRYNLQPASASPVLTYSNLHVSTGRSSL